MSVNNYLNEYYALHYKSSILNYNLPLKLLLKAKVSDSSDGIPLGSLVNVLSIHYNSNEMRHT